MRWSLPIARVFGISIRVHLTFAILLFLFGLMGWSESRLPGMAWALTLLCAIFTCVVLHELGHSVIAKILGVEVNSITLLPIGGVAALKQMPERPLDEMLITIAGPLVNAVILTALLPFTNLLESLRAAQSLPEALRTMFHIQQIPQQPGELIAVLAQVNLALFVFNFLPAFPMDGGRLLRATLAVAMPYRWATTVAARFGQCLALGFIALGILNYRFLWLLIIGAFIFLGAGFEERMVRTRARLRGARVGDLMNRQYAWLAPAEPVGRALALLYQTAQDDFPVIADGNFLGLVSRQAIIEAANRGATDAPVLDITGAPSGWLTPEDDAAQAYERMLGDHLASLPVIQGGQLVGLLGQENLSRYLAALSGLRSKHRPPVPPVVAARTPAPPLLIADVPPVAVPPPLAGPARPADRA
jgi:Zn-dependent protease/predicted transcriptional regulator